MAQWTYRQAWVCLIGSTLTTLTLSLGGYGLLHQWRHARMSDPKYKIVAIVQTGPEREALKSAFLAELLDLSSDKFSSIYSFDVRRAEQKLLDCPLISQAKIKRIHPGTLYVDYAVRKPVAWLSDYQNTGIDREGCFFPIHPFYSPKNLPEIYLGLPSFETTSEPLGHEAGAWKISSDNKYLLLAFDLLRLLSDSPWREGLRIKRIDVSNAFAASAGQREIVLLTEEELTIRENDRESVYQFPKILRLPSKDYAQQLSNFLSLRRTILEDYKRQLCHVKTSESLTRFAPRIIDLRIAQVAFVQNTKTS